ncbi:MAG: hypothetical protein KKH01_09280 [Firmicutes bacterium]|nr:hypothetical protein [Bacillota bacterium]
MKYQITFIIDEKLNKVAQLYIDKKQMSQWETGLTRIEEIKGNLFDTGSEGHLVFVHNNEEIKMKIYVESNQLPKAIVIIYQMPGAWNRCISTFKKVDSKTEWQMDVEFRFNAPQEIGLEKFIEQTSKGMQKFKDFVEKHQSI